MATNLFSERMPFPNRPNGSKSGAALKERNHCHEDAAMRRNVKIFGLEQVNRRTDARIVENNCAQDGALALSTVRQRTLEKLIACVIHAACLRACWRTRRSSWPFIAKWLQGIANAYAGDCQLALVRSGLAGLPAVNSSFICELS